MKKLKSLLNGNKSFFLPCIVLWAVGVVFLCLYDKVSIQLWFNEFYADWQNPLWLVVTFLGDTTFFIICMIAGFFLSRKYVLYSMYMLYYPHSLPRDLFIAVDRTYDISSISESISFGVTIRLAE